VDPVQKGVRELQLVETGGPWMGYSRQPPSGGYPGKVAARFGIRAATRPQQSEGRLGRSITPGPHQRSRFHIQRLDQHGIEAEADFGFLESFPHPPEGLKQSRQDGVTLRTLGQQPVPYAVEVCGCLVGQVQPRQGGRLEAHEFQVVRILFKTLPSLRERLQQHARPDEQRNLLMPDCGITPI
jgi:hypothetical protein